MAVSLFQALGQWGRIRKKRGTSDRRGLVGKEGAMTPLVVRPALFSDPSSLTESLEQAIRLYATDAHTQCLVLGESNFQSLIILNDDCKGD